MNEQEEIVTNEEKQEPDTNTWYDEVSVRPSTLPDITISLTNFAREEDARLLGDIIRGYLDFFGKLMDLSGLSRVWVSYDYEGTLANLERGFETQSRLAPTNDDIGIGIAMTPAILEGGKAKSVMVLNALHMMVLTQPDNAETQPYYRQMTYTLAHECGHVHDLAIKVRSLPGTWLTMRLGRYHGTLFEIADACWSEYIASRLSARLSPIELTGQYEDTFCNQFEAGLPAICGYLRQYRMHGDVPRVLDECSYVVKKILVYASYLFGQLHGLEQSFDEAAPKANAALDHHPELLALVKQLEAELQVLYGSYGSWPSFDVFEPVKRIAFDLFAEFGLILGEGTDDGMSVRIPLTPETMPDLAEQFEFLARQSAQT
jgi:hypothetical protein